MKKSIKILLLSITVIALTAVTIAYATSSTQVQSDENISMVSSESIEKSAEILSFLDSSTENLEKKVIYDELSNKTLYEFENNQYFIDIGTDNNLVGIYSKALSTTQTISNSSTDVAKTYITNKYSELNLPTDYELNYLEKFDDLIWQANFEKNYNGIYNKYESVKVFFIPDTDEIVALTIFNESPSSSEVTITEDAAELTATEHLGITSSEIVSSELTMEKANDVYDSSNADTSVHSVWKFQTNDDSIVYVDAQNNSIIGGDSINE